MTDNEFKATFKEAIDHMRSALKNIKVPKGTHMINNPDIKAQMVAAARRVNKEPSDLFSIKKTGNVFAASFVFPTKTDLHMRELRNLVEDVLSEFDVSAVIVGQSLQFVWMGEILVFEPGDRLVFSGVEPCIIKTKAPADDGEKEGAALLDGNTLVAGRSPADTLRDLASMVLQSPVGTSFDVSTGVPGNPSARMYASVSIEKI